MTIAFRVDASREIGTGHVKRMLSLAKAVRALGGDVVFLWRYLELDSGANFSAAGFEHVRLSPPAQPLVPSDDAPAHASWAGVGPAQDIADCVAALAERTIEWMIVDHYAFDARWHNAMRDRLGCRICAIDDLADRPLAADIVVDHNYADDHRAKYAAVSPAARILGGPRFALLDEIYRDAPRYEFSREVASIGVFMGGADSSNSTRNVLDALEMSGFDGRVEVVTTHANRHLPALERRLATMPQMVLATDLPDLSGFFARHDLQIGAGGGATWERCCIGAPSLGIVVAENQRAALQPLADAGVLPMCDRPDAAAITDRLAAIVADPDIRADYARRARALVDGRGAERVALALLGDRMTLRPATMHDSAQMYVWRNNPAIRSVSRESAPLDRLAHDAWVARAIASPDRRLLIAERGDRALGVIRFDVVDADRCEVSLYVDPALGGLGLGRCLLAAGENNLAGMRGIVAEVLPDNAASARLFAAAGYTEKSPGHWYKSLI